jgi:hypothetical protein
MIVGGSVLFYKRKVEGINFGLVALKNKQEVNLLVKMEN